MQVLNILQPVHYLSYISHSKFCLFSFSNSNCTSCSLTVRSSQPTVGPLSVSTSHSIHSLLSVCSSQSTASPMSVCISKFKSARSLSVPHTLHPFQCLLLPQNLQFYNVFLHLTLYILSPACQYLQHNSLSAICQ